MCLCVFISSIVPSRGVLLISSIPQPPPLRVVPRISEPSGSRKERELRSPPIGKVKSVDALASSDKALFMTVDATAGLVLSVADGNPVSRLDSKPARQEGGQILVISTLLLCILILTNW